MSVSVPNVIGMGRAEAEAALDTKLLRHMARFPFGATGDGSAAAQNPASGTLVPSFAIVVVDYPSPQGPLPDSPIEGPSFQEGSYEGKLTSVMAGNPWGTGPGAWVTLATQLKRKAASISAVLYFDQANAPAMAVDRFEWARRGAILGIAQRAFASGSKVRLVLTRSIFVQSIEIFV